ncbi:CaiB/BaiF CoA transferase family protein [Ramlibacter albus]|uniref:CoA transferase n=1 Tax=Ramlibacter albus TaxID=2079448 RepID=A0A923MBR6_9BURK|nr:CoA transferase [Ramlibacter albus]MBC5767065.1 CoA transferase [Ramlibacter albus]
MSLEEFPDYQPRPPGAPAALDGVRVVEFAHFIAGPFAGTLLANFGADVIKVEAPGRGDEFRYYPPAAPALQDQGAPYIWANRNKRSVTLDLKTEAGLAVARDLVRGADVVIENFSGDVMARFGLDYASCKALKPDIVYCSVSAYGKDGAFAKRLGFDTVAQAESGFFSLNGYADRPGVRAGSPVVDITTATMAANGILAALFHRARTGQGQQLQIALYESATLLTGYAPMQHLLCGFEPQRNGNDSPDTSPTAAFMASDRLFYINCGNDRIYQRLCLEVLERPDLANDPALAGRDGRMERRLELFDILQDIFKTLPWSYWQPRLVKAAIPSAEIRTLPDALRSPEARGLDLVTRIPHPVLGWIPHVRLPLRMGATPAADPRPAPSVGQDTDDVLARTLGYPADRIAQLRDGGALG